MKALNIIQILLDFLIAAGYLIGLIPLGYLIAMWWVIPLTIVVLVLSIIARNGTWPVNALNILMSLLSLIPILGFVPRVLGFILTAVSAIKAVMDML